MRPGYSKYRAAKCEWNGFTFDSKAEAAYACWLDHEQTAGRILYYLRQPKFTLGCPENVYRPDFLVVAERWSSADDVKGSETPKFKKDKRLWATYGVCPLRVVKLTCRYRDDALPTIRKIKYEVIKGGRDVRPSSIHHPDWLRNIG